MAKQSYAAALVDGIYDSLAADNRVSLIGSYVLGLGPQRTMMDRIRKDFPDRIVDPPTAEAGASAWRSGLGAAGHPRRQNAHAIGVRADLLFFQNGIHACSSCKNGEFTPIL